MNVDKSLGPNGLNVGFYKQNWDVIIKCVVDYVKHLPPMES